MKPTLLILAAGMGSRYGGLKQIDKLGPSGEIIADYSVYDAIRAGFGKIVLVIRQSAEADFREIFDKHAQKIEIEYAYQELDLLPAGFSVPADRIKPWGTGHAVLAAKSKITTPFAVINADDFYGAGAYQLLSTHLSNATEDKSTYCMVGFQLNKTLSEFGHVSRGVCETDANNYLKKITERTKIEKTNSGIIFTDSDGSRHTLNGTETVSMNCWGFPVSFFNQLEEKFTAFMKVNGTDLKSEFYLPFAVDELIAEGKAQVKMLQSPDSWFGVTYKEDKPATQSRLTELIEQGKYPKNVWI